MMPSPYTPVSTRIARVDVVGKGWYGQTMATTYNLRDYDLENVDAFTREAFDRWLLTNAGDFQVITDFRVNVGNKEIPFASEEGELLFNDCMFPADL